MTRYWLLMLLLIGLPIAYAAPPLQFVTVKGIAFTNTASNLLQDHQGFIWGGSNSGLYRYDGYQSTHFQALPNTPGSLPNNNVVGLFEDAQQRLWVATRGGLALFNRNSSSFKTYLPAAEQGTSPANGIIQAMCSDGNSGLWLATRAGLQHFEPDTGQFRSYQHDPARPDSLTNNNVQALARDQQGGLWLAAWPSGLDYLPAGSSQFQHQQLIPKGSVTVENNIKSMYVDSKQRLWLGTEGGVFLWQAGQHQAQKMPLSTPVSSPIYRVNRFIEDSAGTVWAGTYIGLLRWDEGRQQFDLYRHQSEDPNSLVGDQVFSFLLDRTGGFLVGTTNGVSYTDLSVVGFEQLMPSILSGVDATVDNSVRAIASAGSGQLWLSGHLNTLLIDLKSRQVIKTLSSRQLFSGVIYSLYQQPEGPLWLGSQSGLLRFEPKTQRIEKISLGDAAANFVNRITPSGHGTLWLGTGNGLVEYDPKLGILRKFHHDALDPNSLAGNAVNTLLVDRVGKVWLSGGRVAGGGVDVLEPSTGKVQHYHFDANDAASLANDFVADMREDSAGNVWVATFNGLSRAVADADGKLKFRNYDSRNGLATSNINAISFDATGKLWLSMDNGIARFDPIAEQFSDYGVFVGEATPRYLDGVTYTESDGSLYFGSRQGLTVVHPEQVRQNLMPPVVAITDISILNRSLADGMDIDGVELAGSVTEPKSLILPWRLGVFSLKFSALHFSDPKRNRYAYQLEGFDRDWIETDSSNRMATYTNLNPGHYVFRVKASNSNGIWNETGISLPITITPSFWQTLWFRALLIGSFLSLLLAVYLWRVRQLKWIQAELEQQVAKRTEELQDMTAKAQAAVQIKSAFLSNMSHEIRTPMNAIIGMTYLTLQTELTPLQRNYQNKINTSSKWLLGILNSILDFSKLEAGKLTLEQIEFSLDSVMQYLAEVTTQQLIGKPLVLSFDVDPDIPSMLIGDPLRLGQILLNLLTNAVKFTATGTVIVRVELLTADADQARLCFSVIDTGIGLSEQQQSHLFDAFTQADDSTTRKYGGTGLGLSISKQLVEAMGGTIGIDSEVGRGSRFYFSVTLGVQPVSESELSPPTAKPDYYPELSNLYLLFVEDDSAIRDMMPDILAHKGIRVDLAVNGAEAIAMIDSNDYSMVLMDCQMPVMDGYKATRIIRNDPRFADLPIIAMTGSVMPEDQVRCLASGMSDHIAKPIDWEPFFATLARWAKPVAASVPVPDLSSGEADAPLPVTPLSLDMSPHQSFIAELSALLANDGFISDDQLTQMKALFPYQQLADYNTLVRYILDTDYPNANATLNTLMNLPDHACVTSAQDTRPIVLIVDDARVNLEILALLLAQDYQVKVAGNGLRALAIAQCFPYPELILLDVRMPEIDGYEVCRQLQENTLTRDIPVIFVTAAFDQESESYGLQLGAADYISKPINPEIVLRRVRNQLLIKQGKESLQRIAHYDALTGIPNRILLVDRMKLAIAQAKREQKMLGVCYLDLDGFKPVNDTLGHQAGDQVLIEIARRISSVLREGDTVARIGGDEFVVLLPNLTHRDECIATVERLREIVALSIYIQDQACFLSASIGVSLCPDDSGDSNVLLDYADQAMYIAKQSGKNRYHFFLKFR